MSFKGIKLAVFAVGMLCLGANVSAQDLIAAQAPIDRKLANVDSLALVKRIKAEQSLDPAIDLYNSWSHENVSTYKDVKIPETYEIDLTNFCLPTTSQKITDVFGYRPRRRRTHYGLDVKVYVGDTIRAAFDGKVRVVKNQGRSGYGKFIVIRHDNGLETVYGHLSKQIVKEDDLVKAGDVIGLGGNTGRSTGSHLHFETRFLGVAIDPAKLFDFEKQDIVADTYTYSSKKASKSSSGSSKATSSGEGVFYKVKRGDTLSKIAARQGVSISKLCQLNHLTTRSTLRIGQVLKCS